MTVLFLPLAKCCMQCLVVQEPELSAFVRASSIRGSGRYGPHRRWEDTSVVVSPACTMRRGQRCAQERDPHIGLRIRRLPSELTRFGTIVRRRKVVVLRRPAHPRCYFIVTKPVVMVLSSVSSKSVRSPVEDWSDPQNMTGAFFTGHYLSRRAIA